MLLGEELPHRMDGDCNIERERKRRGKMDEDVLIDTKFSARKTD